MLHSVSAIAMLVKVFGAGHFVRNRIPRGVWRISLLTICAETPQRMRSIVAFGFMCYDAFPWVRGQEGT